MNTQISSINYQSCDYTECNLSKGVISYTVDTQNTRLQDQRSNKMSLNYIAISAQAKGFVSELLKLTNGESATVRQNNLINAFGAIAADLLIVAAIGLNTPCFRPMSVKSFNGGKVGHRAARTAISLLQTAGFIRLAGGNLDRIAGRQTGIATRIFPLPAFLGLAADHGITPSNRRQHFAKTESTAIAQSDLILLNATTRWTGNRRVKGEPLPVDFSSLVVRGFAEQVARINAFTDKQVIEGFEFSGFHRIFNMGNEPDFAYNKGGRLWCRGGGYQMMPRSLKLGREPEPLRADIRINGEATAEIDIGSSHLTIFLAKLSQSFDPQSDLYQIEGFEREVIKAYINLMLSLPRIPKKWPKSMKDDFLERYGYPIDKHPIADVRNACLAKYPIFSSRSDISINWADLQFIESQAIIDAVDILNHNHGVAALPVHDSLIVQKGNISVASEILKYCFKNYVGINPKVKISI